MSSPPPPLRVFLTKNQEEALFELQKAQNVKRRTRNRALMLRLSSQGWKVEKIAIFFKCSTATVRKTIHRWNKKGLVGLWDKQRPGRNRRWKEKDFEEIENLLADEQCTYNSSKIQHKLLTERQISLSKRQIRRILKKKNFCGKEQDSQIETNKINS